MAKGHYMRSVGRVQMFAFVLLGAVLMVGCSSSATRIQTWEGSVENADQAAVLSAPSSIKVQSVNGQRMGNFLIEDLALDYELLPGKHKVVFTYKTIWAKSGVVENGESKVHVVETGPQEIVIDAKSGETYKFDISKPESRAAAEAYAENFTVELVNASGSTVAQSSPWEPNKRVARSPVPDTQSDAENSDAASQSTMGQLKALWGEATEEEKREFLRWAFE